MTTRAQQQQYDKLADAMQELGIPGLEVARARTGFYSDFESPLPAPKIALVEGISVAIDVESDTVRRAGLEDLRRRVIDGEFDG